MLRFTPLLILALLLLPCNVYGFCVINQHSDDTEFYVRQTDGFKKGTGYYARFRYKHVLPGQMQCCAHTNRSCVGSSDENSIVKFYVHRFYHGSDLGAIEIDCPAGGTLTVSGTGPHASVPSSPYASRGKAVLPLYQF
ncbi:hypothetical protein BJV82DRAFT_573772 [Fennellomyces sp. T-0311]|nr:hypothetical protein BJV82DRAFT_573772 [Fennellomyces sp. T-0311]